MLKTYWLGDSFRPYQKTWKYEFFNKNRLIQNFINSGASYSL